MSPVDEGKNDRNLWLVDKVFFVSYLLSFLIKIRVLMEVIRGLSRRLICLQLPSVTRRRMKVRPCAFCVLVDSYLLD